MVFSMNVSFAQMVSVEGLLDQAVSLTQKGNNSSELVNVLNLGSAALSKELSAGGSGNNNLTSKLLGQAGILKNLIPLATQGNLKVDAISKVVNTIKLLLGANRISNLLGGGKSNLLGNAAALTSNLGLLKAGSSVLGGDSSNILGGLINGVTKNIGKFDKKGFLGIGGGKFAAGMANKKLQKIVSLVGSSL